MKTEPLIVNVRASVLLGSPMMPNNGVIKERTKELMSSVKAAPRTTATQRSTTLPRKMKSLMPVVKKIRNVILCVSVFCN